MKKRTRDLLMLLSFLGVSAFTYFFHIVQAHQKIRTYLTGISLLTAYLCLSLGKDKKIKTCWIMFFAWVLQSSIYYNPQTHLHGYLRFIKHIIVAVIAVISALDKHNIPSEIFTWTILAITPDVSSNVYGNAMFSILRLFIMTVILLLDKKDTKHNELIWLFMCHEFILGVALLQLALKVLPVTTQDKWPWLKWKSSQPSDVITSADVPFLLGADGQYSRRLDLFS